MNRIFLVIFLLLFIITLKQSIASGESYNVYDVQNYSQSAFNPDERILFIVDFSNSMVEKINGEKKIDIAISTLEKILRQIPKSVYVGFRAYGHRSGLTYFDSCRASSLITPIGQNNSHIIQGSMYKLSPRGSTPITYSLKQAVNKDFKDYNGKKRIILLSDGGENCDESPCTYALELIKQRSDFRIDVIALDVNDKEAVNQLKCAALATSGKFYSANTAAELLNSFQDSLNIKKDVQGMIIP